MSVSLVHITFTFFGGAERDAERDRFYDQVGALGRWAWASGGECYLLTALPFATVATVLRRAKRPSDFLTLTELSGRFFIDGERLPQADALLLAAHELGIIELSQFSSVMYDIVAVRAGQQRRIGESTIDAWARAAQIVSQHRL